MISKKIKFAAIYIILGLLALTCLIPFIMMLVNASRTGQQIIAGFTLIPGTALADNWNVVMDKVDIFPAMLRSFFVAASVTVLSSYFSALTAYVFAFYKFPGSKALFSFLIGMMMVPGTLGLFGFYDLCNALGMVDTYYPLIIPSIASTGTVFFLRQFAVSTIPPSMLEAPRIDGASEIGIFHRIVFPMLSPGIATMAIGAFIGTWNSYTIPLIILNSPNKFLLTQVTSTLNTEKDIMVNQGATYMAISLSVLPILIAFVFCSKYIVNSIAAGSVKE